MSVPRSTGPEPDDERRPAATRLVEHLKAGGTITPILTALLAFVVGGLVVLATGEDPISTYRAIFDGTGLNWLWASDRALAETNLQQTLLLTAPLILAGLAVAYAFRAGLFNIGANGQYIAGAVVAVWIGSSWAGMPGALHALAALAGGAAAGAAWGGLIGFLRATTGANEVISSIMLNYTALWIGTYLFAVEGPLHSDAQREVPVSADVVEDARLPVFWGDPDLQGLHVGIFVALLAAGGFWLLLKRGAKGYEARAVGLNPEAARCGGIDVGRTYVYVMLTCGLLAGLAGAIDVLGWQFRINTNDLKVAQVGFLAIAVALLGRSSALGTCAAALLFGALLQGTSVRNLDPEVYDPALAANLTTVIQGVVVLLVSADVLVAWLFKRRRRGGGDGAETGATVSAAAGATTP